MIPSCDEKCETIYWDGRTFPWGSFYLIHAITVHLLELLDASSHISNEKKDDFEAHVIKQSHSLTRLLDGILLKAWEASFYAALAFQHVLWDEEDDQRGRARVAVKERLNMIRKLLYLDKLFRKREMSGSDNNVSVSAENYRSSGKDLPAEGPNGVFSPLGSAPSRCSVFIRENQNA